VNRGDVTHPSIVTGRHADEYPPVVLIGIAVIFRIPAEVFKSHMANSLVLEAYKELSSAIGLVE
jgi:hypothetical protein